MKKYSLIIIILIYAFVANAQNENMYIYKTGNDIKSIPIQEIDSISFKTGAVNYLKIHKTDQVIDIASSEVDSIIFYEVIAGNTQGWEINAAMLGDEMVSFKAYPLHVEATVNDNEWVSGINDYATGSTLIHLPYAYFNQNQNVIKFRVNIDGNIGPDVQDTIYKGSYIHNSDDSTNINITCNVEGVSAKDIIVSVNNSMDVANPDDDTNYLMLPDSDGNILVSNLPSSGGINISSPEYESFTYGLSPDGSIGQTYDITVNMLPIVEGTKLTGLFLKRTEQGDVPFEETDGDVWMHLHRLNGVATEALFSWDESYNNATGEYEITRLAGGEYTNSLFWPIAGVFLNPGPYTLITGETTTINFVIENRKGVISGKVTALDGVTPVSGCNITMQKEINMGGVITYYNSEMVTTDDQGNYSLETFYGNYTLDAFINEGGSFGAENIEISVNPVTFNFNIDTTAGDPSTTGINIGSAVTSDYYTGLTNPAGMDIDASGNIYVAEYGSNQIVKIDNANQTEAVIASGIANPVGVTLYNNFLYCATNSGGVIKIDLSDNSVTEIANHGDKKLGDIEVYNDTTIYVSEFDMNSEMDNGGGQKIHRIDPQTGNIDYTWEIEGVGVYGLKYKDNNTMYCSQLAACTLMEIDFTNNIISNLNTEVMAQLGDIVLAPNSMVVSSEIIIGDNDSGDEIIFIDPTTRAAVSYPLTYNCKPFGVVLNGSDLYVSELNTGKITKITGIVFNSLE